MADRKRWSDYTASILWSIGKMLGGDDYPFPNYSEYLHPEIKDERTSQDIISGLIDKLSA